MALDLGVVSLSAILGVESLLKKRINQPGDICRDYGEQGLSRTLSKLATIAAPSTF